MGAAGWERGRTGSMAEFDRVPPGFRKVRGFDPNGNPVAQAEVEVRAGAVTLVHLNFPVTEQ